MARVFILMMDSFGIGGASDAEKFGDEGADTFGHIVDRFANLQIPNLVKLGLVEVANKASKSDRKISSNGAKMTFEAKYGHCMENTTVTTCCNKVEYEY